MDYTYSRTKTAEYSNYPSLGMAFQQFLVDTAAQVFGPRVAPDEKYQGKASKTNMPELALSGDFDIEVTAPVVLKCRALLQVKDHKTLEVFVHMQGSGGTQKKEFNVGHTTPPGVAQWITDVCVEAAASAQPGASPREPAEPEAEGIKKGDIFVSSWGYDQTNVDFYEIVDVKGKIVVIREIHKRVTPGSHGSDKVMPIPGNYDGEPMRKRPSYRNGKPSIKMTDYAWAYPWDGKPEDQTASGYGH